ncbi:7-deoxyloganetin glucosyltransferase-like [Camellia sinensis]|uniref:7-deoxyloganetin glucosyltransferase-like n=1 Tax=Camellia sinensis TaxID=4442 RepID=UPI0010361E0D|nr:7-deoxyloganetin glucosyltransferase-like [Camellia sinensis]
MDSRAMLEKPHAVCIPFPVQGHINPMLKLAKLLHNRGFHITFVNTEFNHKRLLKSRGPDSLNGLPSFRFEAIPDGLPESDADATQEIPSLLEATSKHCLAPFKDLIYKLNNTATSNVPQVTCIVSDAIMCFTLAVAEELGIPHVFFWSAGACGFMGMLQYRNLIEKGFLPVKDPSSITNEYLNTVIDWIPSMQGIRLKDIPSIIHSVNLSDFMIKFALEINEKTLKSSAIIFNTFEKLEHEVLYALSSTFPPVYTIGPLQLLLNQVKDDSLKSIGSNLWKEVPGCLEWLNSKEPNSVVYVNYGSITVMTSNQLIEFAWGLANSNQTFLWIVRPDLVAGDLAIIPPEFVIETKERGLLASWCPQEQVLAHPSIGGFLTHCGWNSTIESISSGVPMICWPYFGDQQTNCWYSCTQWGIGVEMDNDVKRDVVERLVRELMYGHKGKEMKKRVMEWRKIAEEATMSSSASSFLNLEKMIMQVLLPPRR